MSRIAPPIPVSPQMYRHFAVITVIITACLAMFANGENSEIIEKAAAKQHVGQAANSRGEGKGEAKVNKGMAFKDGRTGGWGTDEGSGGSAPARIPVKFTREVALSPSAGGMARQIDVSKRKLRQSYELPDVLPPGMTQEQFDRYVLVKQAQTAETGPSEEELGKLLEQSRQRSGAAEGAD